MTILAIEQSTDVCSVAILRDNAIVADESWEDTRLRNQHIFIVLPGFLRSAGIGLEEIDTFAVGVGPGGFSGLRMTIAAACGFAMPAQRQVFGVSSAETLAWTVARENACRSVAVIGDARRGSYWLGAFEHENGLTKPLIPLSLAKPDELPGIIKGIDLVVTPDWNRIGADLAKLFGPDPRLKQGRCIPKASALGMLAQKKIEAGIQSEKLTPLYLHPPVFVEPRSFAEAQ